MDAAFWVCAAITAISSFVSLGYSIAGLRAAAGQAVVPSRYAAARSLALAVVAVVALFAAAVPFVAAVAIAMIVVQAVDAVIGIPQRDTLKTWGPAITAIVNLAALIWMLVA